MTTEAESHHAVATPGSTGEARHVTAVVVNWNAGEMLARCVHAVRASTGVTVDEIIVVDNASSDGSLETVRDVDNLRVVQTGANLGYGTGCNRGVREARSAFVAVLNPDLEMAPDAIGRMVDFLAEDPERGMVGPRLLEGDGAAHSTCGRAPGFVDAIGRKFLLHLVFPFFKFRRLRPERAARVGWVTGACQVARRSALESVGGFDEAIFMYFEDLDLCARLNAAGWGVWYLPDASGRHVGGVSSSQALERMLLASEQSYRYYTRKHMGAAASGFLAALTPVEMLLRSLLWSVVYVASGTRRHEATARLRAYRKAFLNDFRGATPPAAPTAS